MKRPKPTLEPAMVAELRSAIDDSHANLYALAKKAGIDQAAVRRFVSRERSLSLDSAGRLAEALGLKLVRSSKPRKFSGSEASKVKHGESPRQVETQEND